MNRTHFDSSPMPQPLLTVIVPVYNEEPTVERILQRILDAPYPDKEIIVVDDSSQGGTIVSRCAARRIPPCDCVSGSPLFGLAEPRHTLQRKLSKPRLSPRSPRGEVERRGKTGARSR